MDYNLKNLPVYIPPKLVDEDIGLPEYPQLLWKSEHLSFP